MCVSLHPPPQGVTSPCRVGECVRAAASYRLYHDVDEERKQVIRAKPSEVSEVSEVCADLARRDRYAPLHRRVDRQANLNYYISATSACGLTLLVYEALRC